MPEIKFTIPGEPQGKARHRTVPIYGRDGNPVMKNGRVILRQYTPKKTEDYEKLIAMRFLDAAGKRLLLDCPVQLGLIAYYKIAKSDNNARREGKLTQRIPCTKKPDIDNVLKCVKDGLNEVAYQDDSQVVRTVMEKRWGDTPRVDVWLRWSDD